MRDLSIEALRKLAAFPIEASLKRYMRWLVPETATGILPVFWETEAGELLAEAHWRLYCDEAVSIVEAAKLLGRPGDNAGVMYVKAHLPLYRKPKQAYKVRRKHRVGYSRAWYVRRSDIEAFKGGVHVSE